MDSLIKEISELTLKIQELEQLREVKQIQLRDMETKCEEEELSSISSSNEEMDDHELYPGDFFTEEEPPTPDNVKLLRNHFSKARKKYERMTSPEVPIQYLDPDLFNRCAIDPIDRRPWSPPSGNELKSMLTREIKEEDERYRKLIEQIQKFKSLKNKNKKKTYNKSKQGGCKKKLTRRISIKKNRFKTKRR